MIEPTSFIRYCLTYIVSEDVTTPVSISHSKKATRKCQDDDNDDSGVSMTSQNYGMVSNFQP